MTTHTHHNIDPHITHNTVSHITLMNLKHAVYLIPLSKLVWDDPVLMKRFTSNSIKQGQYIQQYQKSSDLHFLPDFLDALCDIICNRDPIELSFLLVKQLEPAIHPMLD